ncbi:MAG: hypothetical protein AB7T10_01275 [bacterium]
MLKILEDFFINRKLSTLKKTNKTLNIQKNLENPARILVMYNENLRASKDVFSVSETLKARYPQAKVEFLFFRFHSFYREIFSVCGIFIDIPSLRHFTELEELKKHITQHGHYDMLFDMSTFDIRMRKMVVRTINPGISIALFENNAEEDYNILLKNSKPDWMSIYETLNYKLVESTFKDNLAAIKEKNKPGEFEIVILGSSRRMKNEMKKAFKERKKFLLVENLSKQLDFFSFMSIRNCKNIKNDSSLDEDIRFIKGIEV